MRLGQCLVVIATIAAVPTFLMFSYMSSAIGLLKYPGQALPSRREVYVVSVISVAALAMLSPMCHMFMMWS